VAKIPLWSLEATMNMDEVFATFLHRPPRLDPTAYVHPSATLLGDVQLGPYVTVLPQVVLRGDINFIRVGAYSNIQDGTVIHLSDAYPVIIGEWVTIGHSAVVHACTIHDRALIGMNATVLDGAVIGEDSLIGANALVPAGMQIPPRSLVLGVPGKIIREVTAEQIATTRRFAEKYVALGQELKKLLDTVP
jgi:gamma-carbonic anhydrase